MIAVMSSTNSFWLSTTLVILSINYHLVFQTLGLQRQGELQSYNINLQLRVSNLSPACFVDHHDLVESLVDALPSYTNRVLQHSPDRGLGEKSGYMIEAQQLKKPPFSLNHQSVESDELFSVYLMTIERRYDRQAVFNVKRYHLLFLRDTPQGWELVRLFSQSGSYPGSKLFPDPMETSKGAMAKAIRLWLRDLCPMT